MSVLLRLFLSLMLVLNGIGSVAAAARMAVASQHAVSAPSAAPEHGESMAHAGHDQPDEPPAAQATAVASTGTDAVAQDDHSDCCETHSCNCACVQAGAAVMLSPLSAPLVFQRSVSVPKIVPARPAPELPFPLRPPIA